MDPEKSRLTAELAIDPEQAGEIQPEGEKLCAHFKVPESAIYRNTVGKYCTFRVYFSFLISAGLFVNLFLTLIAL